MCALLIVAIRAIMYSCAYKYERGELSTMHFRFTHLFPDEKLAAAAAASYTRQTDNLSEGRHTSGDKVDSVERNKRNQQARELFKPSVKVRGRHEQHPPTHGRHTQRHLDTQAQIPVVRHRHVALCIDRLDSRALDGAIVHDDPPLLAKSRGAHNGGQNLQPQHGGTHDQDKDMAGDVVAAAPGAPDGLASSVRKHLPRIAHLGLFLVGARRVRVDDCALAAGIPKPAIDERRTKEPLRDGAPDGRDEQISQRGLDASGRQRGREARAQRRVAEEEKKKRRRDPDPADFDKEDVEDVGLFGKVAGGHVGRVRL